MIVGSPHGWLVTADARSELHLLNPATGDQLSLPSVTTIEQVTPVFSDAGDLQRYDLSYYDATLPRKEYNPPKPYAVDRLRRSLYFKVVLSCDPSSSNGDGDCVLMMIHNPYRQLSFARLGTDHQWHWVTTSFRHSKYSDCIYHDGAFYAMNRQGGIHRYTIQGSCSTLDIIFKDTLPYTPAYNMYIARTMCGDVLQIFRITSESGESLETHTDATQVYKVDFDKQDIVEEIDDTLLMKDNALFIGHSYSSCFPTEDYPSLRANHVYFTDDDEYSLMEDSDNPRDVGVYNLEDDSVAGVVSPQPWLNWPNPIWIVPSFTKIDK
ncbi:hypothetical protein PR202_gb00674 [Eleusine coracana subsp. coracana]|uniref:KIB1-4 beta-propeller domain-containing protein n=1 Tax=Eleusine coracana subsp. coracana TaxID=191504 RepID=A0AAV5DSH3_ELECO|nr:hypothetical protein QOZ80_5BG0426770 [Eleusine coracana subsp. coracana]GJN13918.1 hypothetical protein PR202_gb00674 [Eleusine coracana subsp. coracana]